MKNGLTLAVILIGIASIMGLIGTGIAYEVSERERRDALNTQTVICERQQDSYRLIDGLAAAAIEVVKSQGVTPEEEDFVAHFQLARRDVIAPVLRNSCESLVNGG